VNPGHHINYRQLRKVNPKAARLTVLRFLESVSGNVSRTARVFGINRSVVYDILKKQASGDLNDRSKVPRRQPQKNTCGSRTAGYYSQEQDSFMANTLVIVFIEV